MCLWCPSQKLQLPLREFAMSWSAASLTVRPDLSIRFRGYNSMWDLNCSYSSWWKMITSNQSVFITTFILILMLCFYIRLPLPPGAFSGLWKNQEAFWRQCGQLPAVSSFDGMKLRSISCVHVHSREGTQRMTDSYIPGARGSREASRERTQGSRQRESQPAHCLDTRSLGRQII